MKTDSKTKNLYKALLLLKTDSECQKFLRDLLTESEIKEFANRWAVAQMLDQKINYETIEKETGMSSTTIARISKWVNNGMGGYQLMLKRLSSKTKNHHRTSLVAV
ncbi:MAG TPA: YerC/YecD family TrpR-related protein [Candidatus Saccharimonadales bacterium]|nr:YerC/YecD family TrpR-related protein [Candidatus Saccharimonadales bacterium]